MQVTIATPGVSTTSARRAVGTTADTRVVRAARCGAVALPQPATTVTVCVRRCAVSIQAAQQVVATLPAAVTATIAIVDTDTVPRWLHQQFTCPVRCLQTTGGKLPTHSDR